MDADDYARGVMLNAVQLCEWTHASADDLAPLEARARRGEPVSPDDVADIVAAHREGMLRVCGFAAMVADYIARDRERARGA